MHAPHAGATWHHYCRIMLEWLHPRPDLDPETWVDEVVDRAQHLQVDTLAFDFYHGGYAIFNGAAAPKDRHVGTADLLALLDRALHQRGMRLVIMNMGRHGGTPAVIPRQLGGSRRVQRSGNCAGAGL